MASGGFKGRYFSYSYRIAKEAQYTLCVCLHDELSDKGIHVSAARPGRSKTASGAFDADMEACEAAEAMYRWIQTLNRDNSC